MRIAVILSGCGYLDGAEIRESVLSLLYLDQCGAEVEIFAPDKPQMHVVNHKSGDVEEAGVRNILQESARIARGNVSDLAGLDPENFDALVIPGGYGVAKNLSDFALKGSDMEADNEFERVVRSFYKQSKPIGAMCISPAVIAGILRDAAIEVTIGNDNDCALAITAMGGTHIDAATDVAVEDKRNKIVTCCAYMREDSIANIAMGIEKVINTVCDMVKVNQVNAA